jgi:hypothetical protein
LLPARCRPRVSTFGNSHAELMNLARYPLVCQLIGRDWYAWYFFID